MLKRALLVLGATMALLGLLLAPTSASPAPRASNSVAAQGALEVTPAQAALPVPSCGYFLCMWWDINGGPPMTATNRNIGSLGEPWKDDISSVRNTTGFFVGLFEHDLFQGRCYLVHPREYVPDLGWFNDKLSSIRFAQYQGDACAQ